MSNDPLPEATLDRLARTLLQGPDAVIYAGSDGAIRFWNAGAERLFGFTEAEALGQSLDIIIPEGLRKRHWTGYDDTMKTGQSRYGAGDILSVPALHKDGRRLSVEFTVAMLKRDDGTVKGIAAVLRDNTARFDEMKRLRKAASAAQA